MAIGLEADRARDCRNSNPAMESSSRSSSALLLPPLMPLLPNMAGLATPLLRRVLLLASFTESMSARLVSAVAASEGGGWKVINSRLASVGKRASKKLKNWSLI